MLETESHVRAEEQLKADSAEEDCNHGGMMIKASSLHRYGAAEGMKDDLLL